MDTPLLILIEEESPAREILKPEFIGNSHPLGNRDLFVCRKEDNTGQLLDYCNRYQVTGVTG